MFPDNTEWKLYWKEYNPLVLVGNSIITFRHLNFLTLSYSVMHKKQCTYNWLGTVFYQVCGHFSLQIINSEEDSSWNTNSHSASQEIPCHLLVPESSLHVHKSPPLDAGPYPEPYESSPVPNPISIRWILICPIYT